MKQLYRSIFFAILLTTFQTTEGDKDHPLSITKKCKVGCKNYIKVLQETPKIRIMNIVDVELNKIVYPEKIKLFVLARRFYRALVSTNWGARPVMVETGNKKPDAEEAEQWLGKMRCQIGTVCPPNGDCWGSTSELCKDNPLKYWVTERQFKFAGTTWNAAFHYACTYDWECSLTPKMFSIHTDDSGRPIVQIGEETHTLDDSPKIYIDKGTYVVAGEGITRAVEQKITAKCFREKGNLFCEENSEDGSVYFTIRDGNKCEKYANTAYCRNGPVSNTEEEESIVPISSTDINQLKDAINVISQISDFNFFKLKKELADTKKSLIGIILELLRSNPNILSSFFPQRTYVRVLEGNIVEACPCVEDTPCNEKEQHYPDLSFCPKTTQNLTSIKIFASDDEIINIDPAKFVFQGIDTNPTIDLLEKEILEDKKFINTGESNSSILSQVSFLPVLWETIIKYSGLVALLILLSNLFFRRQ